MLQVVPELVSKLLACLNDTGLTVDMSNSMQGDFALETSCKECTYSVV